ncbi:hypothetical protein [Clostridium thermarum]|uniref:hypothetical protein n=1 Tax=Clostridium thermarum TaxID=1716543 RepID=UPI0013D5C44D|nr:hypothetical protein [Clostridium thermarum]
MANNIVFQHSAEQLKTAVYGYDGTDFQPIKVNADGELQVNVGTIRSLGTVNYVVNLGTLNTVGTLNNVTNLGTLNTVVNVGTLSTVGTLNNVTNLGTLNTVVNVGTLSTVGTLNNVTNLGTLNTVVNVGTLSTVGTLNNVTNLGTLNTVVNVGTLSTVGTLNNVTNLGTLNTVVNVGTLSTVGTVNNVTNLGTLNTVVNLGTLNSIIGTVNVNLADRTFTSTTFTVEVAGSTSTYVSLIDVSKYQDTSWYLRNITATANRQVVRVQLAVTPSNNTTLYPRVLINETATINENPKVITNDYYMRYITAQVSNENTTTQTVVIVFNGRY